MLKRPFNFIILVEDTEVKISQYADDTTLILNGAKKSLEASLLMLDAFYNISGLKMNSEKTEALWIGALSNNEQVLFPERNLKWAKYSVKALGVWSSINITKSLALNYKEKTEKIRNITENWSARRLTMFG